MNNTAMKIMIGSQNYNLADENSDFDFKEFLVPTYEDIYYNRNLNKEVANDQGIVFYKSLKDLPHMLVDKSSWSNIELLFSENAYASNGASELSAYIATNLSDIVTANPIKLWYSTMGEVQQRLKYIEAGKHTAGTKHLFDVYGYDTKEAMHTFRLMRLMRRYIYRSTLDDCLGFKYLLWNTQPYRENLLGIKYGRFSKEECLINIKDEESDLLLLKEEFLAGKSVNHKITYELEEIVRNIIKNWNHNV